jgi:uncharacterized coiled-coil DUF342 family protein
MDVYKFLAQLNYQLREQVQTNQTLVQIQKVLIDKQKEELESVKNELTHYKQKNVQIIQLSREAASEKTRADIYEKQLLDLKHERDELKTKVRVVQTHLENQNEQRKKLRTSYRVINDCVVQHEVLNGNNDVKEALEILKDNIKN